ncbi:helix-turn-helix domain-containing protein [Actinomadura rubrisoli]|uniref:XRE family transcriptional regulator n=1 Tax=Actinomadura rubrisoli TaxID=2530368 RepID=A0A4R5A802_9ACTN|nr:helix-turn-helix transcriptional regulator [Actinomadura rubrisoli]TDD66784.1 XRE family transcriptional regulator [Actinomadura rubrisoli]
MATLADVLRDAIADRNMSLRAVARAAPCDPGHLSHIARGHYPPSKSLARALERVLGIPGRLTPFLASEEAAEEATVEGDNPGETDADVRRRQVIRMLTTLGISGAVSGTSESVRQLLAQLLDSESRDLDAWHLTISDHLYALRTRPAASAREGLVIDLLAIEQQLRIASASKSIELQRVIAALSMIHANVLTRLGEHGESIHWSRTANAAADASGDLELGLLTRAMEASLGLYGQRDPVTVLQLTINAQQNSGKALSIGRARIDLAHTKALSMLGRHEEAKRCLQPLLTSAPPPANTGIMPTLHRNHQAVWFAESWVRSYAGEEAHADHARDQVLSTNPSHEYYAKVRLHEALCATVNGAIGRGIGRAIEIFDELPPAHRTQMIIETGEEILRAVPLDLRGRPVVRDLRAIMNGAAPLT